jgi:hypothetical protein
MAKPKCDNCELDAVYTCADAGTSPVNYCQVCLPQWLQERADAGHFPLVEAVEEKPSKKKAAPAEDKAEEVPADESN